jgi:type II secretory pathway pseudopilin PulG
MLWRSSVFSKKRPHPQSVAGFSLVELMISIGIMVLVISVVTTSQGAFNGAVLLRGQAYEAALKIREVQLSAVGSVTGGATVRTVYGVHFDSSAATDNQYKIFKDANSNGFYNSGEEYGQQGFLDSRFEIRAIRAIGDSIPANSGLSVVFVRPNFDARFFSSSGEVFASSVEIDVADRDATGAGPGDVRTVEVTSAGQISVQSI